MLFFFVSIDEQVLWWQCCIWFTLAASCKIKLLQVLEWYFLQTLHVGSWRLLFSRLGAGSFDCLETGLKILILLMFLTLNVICSRFNIAYFACKILEIRLSSGRFARLATLLSYIGYLSSMMGASLIVASKPVRILYIMGFVHSRFERMTGTLLLFKGLYNCTVMEITKSGIYIFYNFNNDSNAHTTHSVACITPQKIKTLETPDLLWWIMSYLCNCVQSIWSSRRRARPTTSFVALVCMFLPTCYTVFPTR